jgi:hypothetical protein
MKERWIQVKPDADKKQEEWLNGWVSGKGITFQNPEAEAQYRETAQMIVDAIQLQKPPKRVPISPSVGYFPIEYAGISYHDMMYNQEVLIKACKKYCDDFKPDTFGGPLPMAGRVFDLLDFQMYHWPGHGLPKDREFQFVEKEYMTVDEYQDLIDDPTAWFLGVYFPRIFGTMKSLTMMPVLPNVNEMPMVMPAVIPFGMQDVQDSLKILMEAGEAAVAWLKGIRKFSLSIIGQGYPAVGGGLIKAPFDVIGDSLRGTKGIMIDLFRCPDKIKEACERLAPIMVKSGIASARASGSPFIMIPLHKGADGFMSEEQFLTLYWPTLRQVLIGLIDVGLVPIPFAEGSYNSRLEIISDLPERKTIWIFDRTDMARAKETIGKVACLQGNVPLSLMCAGTPDEVRAYCKNVIEVAGKGGGYILSTGAGLQGAKPENLKALIDAGREFGVYN